MSDPARISPTAHYTGYVWARNGLSPPELGTREGRAMYELMRPAMLASRTLGGAQLEPYLLTRHAAIDALLTQAIEDHGITQVLEVACGLSARGWRFYRRYGERITYVEADLPAMAERKRAALERAGSLGPGHRVKSLDALSLKGPESLPALAEELEPGRGLVIITEGLLNYLPQEVVLGLWRRIAGLLSGFSGGRYISDIHLGSGQGLQVRAAQVVLAAFVRGTVDMHFGGAAEAQAKLHGAGFGQAELHRAVSIASEFPGAGAGLGHILEASTV